MFKQSVELFYIQMTLRSLHCMFFRLAEKLQLMKTTHAHLDKVISE